MFVFVAYLIFLLSVYPMVPIFLPSVVTALFLYLVLRSTKYNFPSIFDDSSYLLWCISGWHDRYKRCTLSNGKME